MNLQVVRPNGISMISLGFWLLSILIFCNVNGIIFLLFNSVSLVSPLILAICVLTIYFLNVRKSDFSGVSILFSLLLSSTILFGLLPALYYYGSTNFQFYFISEEFRDVATSLIIFNIFYLVFSKLDIESRIKYLKFIYFFFLFTCSFAAFEQALGFRSLYQATEIVHGRALGFFGNPNLTGLQANFTLAMTLGLFLMKRINIWLAMVGLSVSLLGGISTFSKMAIICAVLIVLVFLLYVIFRFFSFDRQNRRRSFAFIFVQVLLLSIWVIPNLQNMYNELSTGGQKRIEAVGQLIVNQDVSYKTTSGRSTLYYEAFNKLSTSPIFGFGTATFTKPGMLLTSPTHGVHNVFLKIWGEAGIFGLLIFLSFIVLFTRSALRTKRPELVFLLLACLLVFLIAGFTTHTVLRHKMIVGFLGVLCGIVAKN